MPVCRVITAHWITGIEHYQRNHAGLNRKSDLKRELPGFSKNVIFDEEAICYLHPLHELVMKGSCKFGKEENLLLLTSLLIQQYSQHFESCTPECRE